MRECNKIFLVLGIFLVTLITYPIPSIAQSSAEDDDLLKEMESMRQEMEARLRRNDELLRNAKPGQVYTLKSGPVIQELSRQERDGKLFIQLYIPNLNEGKFKIEVQRGYLVMSGETRKQEIGKGYMGLGVQQFTQILPLPSDVNPQAAQYQREKNRILVIVPKVTPETQPAPAPSRPQPPQVI